MSKLTPQECAERIALLEMIETLAAKCGTSIHEVYAWVSYKSLKDDAQESAQYMAAHGYMREYTPKDELEGQLDAERDDPSWLYYDNIVHIAEALDPDGYVAPVKVIT